MTAGVRNGLACIALAGLLAVGCGGRAAVVGSPGPEGVSFLVTPSDAEVVVDNVVRGKASDFPDDRPLRLATGDHSLELRAAGYATYARSLAVSLRPKRVEATLPRKEEPPVPPKEKNGAPPPSAARQP